MKYILPIILLLSGTLGLKAQSIKGKITNPSGEPIPYATIYIQQLRQGTSANAKGDYELKLDPGAYEVTYQSLGYEPVLININLAAGSVIRNVVLPLQYYQIPEVRISATGEDPAYIIMRKVIGMAPYYLNNVSSYKAEVYLKGNLLIKKIPKILQKSMKMEAKRNAASVSAGGKSSGNMIKEGDAFFMESYNEIDFSAPDRYHQKVISFNSTFPEEGNEISPMSFIQASFYEPVIAEMAISPLSPAAFSHYNFKYIGSSLQGNYTINKIQVIPKRKSQQLFSGTIFIIEDLWCLHSIDLENENLVGKIRVQQLYVPVQDDIWMPVSHKFDVDISIMGFRGEAAYGSSVKYLDVKPNTSLKKPETITTNYGGRQQKPEEPVPSTKTEKEISKILSKDELSNRDMIKLSKLMEKESEKSDTSRKSLEIKDPTTQVVEKDAGKKDSAYWAQIRPIPLSDIEKKSIRVSDSIKTVSLREKHPADTTNVSDTVPAKKKSSRFVSVIKGISTGNTWRDTIGNTFLFSGLLKPRNFGFNTVDGFLYGMDFRYTKSWKENRMFGISPDFQWSFGREALLWKVNGFYRFNRLKPAQLYCRIGQTSADINNGTGINIFLNTSYSLLLKKNYLKLYESGYMVLGYRKTVTNGFTIDLSATYEERGLLENNSSFSFFNKSKQYTPNVPENQFLLPGQNPFFALRDMRHADITARLVYTPFQKYRMYKGNKIPAGSDWPTFILTYQHGINEFSELANSLKHIDMIRIEASDQHDLGAFSEYSWLVRSGGFINKKYATFYDFYHVNAQPLVLSLNSYNDAFSLPAFYSMSTPDFFFQGHFKYTTPYLLLKLLPGLSKTLIRENLSISYLGSDFFRNNYTELGYSLSEIFFLAELGVYAGFDNVRFMTAGVSLTLKLN